MQDPNGALRAKHDLSRFRTLFLAGQNDDPVGWMEEFADQNLAVKCRP
jgi:hypothetical protein